MDKAASILAELKHPIAVAKVNADKYKRLASKHDIDAYPTLMIFTHGVPTEYYGPRKADLLVRYLRKFVTPDVAVLDSDNAVREFVKAADTHFPIFIGFGVNESQISDLAVKYKKKAWFSVAKDFTEEIMEYYEFFKTPALVALHEIYHERNIFYGPFEDSFLEDYVKQSLLPLVLPINQDTLKLLKDDQRKIALTIVEDESDDKSEKLIKLLKGAASANRDLVFGYVGFKQFEEFAESFGYSDKTKLPKMVVWDGNEDYLSVVGSESIEEEDQGTQITTFLEGYREGKVIKKQISGPSFFGYLSSVLGIRVFYIAIFLLLVLVLILQFTREEDRADRDRDGDSAMQPEVRETRISGDKED